MKTLIIALTWPEPDATAAGRHMMDLISAVRELSSEITFACTAADSDHAACLPSIGIHIQKIAVNDPGFDIFLKALDPDLVVFDRFMAEEQFGWRVREHCPHALRVLNTEDLHGLRKSRELELKGSSVDISETSSMNDVMRREIASMYRSDLNLIISTAEMELLKERFRFEKSQLQYFPLLSDNCDERHQQTIPAFEKRSGFVTIGSFRHPPNQDSVQWMKHEIWGKIRKLKPDAQFRVYGSYMNDQWKELHDESEGFLMIGAVDEVEDALRDSRVLLAPLRFGAGLKGKLLDAMYWGIPFVTTPIGMEGYETNLGLQSNVADKPDDFAALAVKLYDDKGYWYELQSKGFNRINSGFNRAVHSKSLLRRLENTIGALKQVREANTIGEIFWHNSLLSTKYMSRWIELKNSKLNSVSEKTAHDSEDEEAGSDSQDIIGKR